jgi:thiosulfate/3-mercaptopyruvate sulfurtransferase
MNGETPIVAPKGIAMKPIAAWVFNVVALTVLSQPVPAVAQHQPAASIPAADLIQPADLAATLQQKAAPSPLILQVGSRVLFSEAHIPGSEYAGPAGQDGGLQALRTRVAKLPKDTYIVLYCGCCPWSRCPNIAAAYDGLRTLGFNHLRVLYIADDFGTNWVDKGYPVAKGG